MWVFSGWVWRNDRFTSAFREPISQLICIISPVSQQPPWCGDPLKEQGGANQIMGLPRCNRQSEGTAPFVGYGMNFSRPSAARSSDGLLEIPPFAPAAERWALMWVESSAVVDTTTLLPVRA